MEGHGGHDMKIIFKWFSWWDGPHERTVTINTIKQGNPSIPSWKQFNQAVRDLNGKKVRIEVVDHE